MNLCICALLLFVNAGWTAETRFKVGYKRWAFNINTSDGKHQREEFVDEDGISHGRFIFADDQGKTKEFKYKFDSTKEPDFVFNTDAVSNDSDSAMFNYSSITNDKEFAGHVIFKIGNSMYDFNFMTGDKLQTREEILNSDGLMYGKFTFLDEGGQLRVVRYRFNVTGDKPEFEVSLDNRATEKQNKLYKPPFGAQPSLNHYPQDNRLTRRILPPQQHPSYRSSGVERIRGAPIPAHRPGSGSGSPSGQSSIVPSNGNWYYNVQ